MADYNEPVHDIFRDLRERTKELDCLYKIEELLSKGNESLDDIFHEIVNIIPPGFMYPDICVVRILYKGNPYSSPNFKRTPWQLSSPICMHGERFGKIEVCYLKSEQHMDDNPYLKEERRLLKTIADRLGHAIFQIEYQKSMKDWDQAHKDFISEKKKEWRIILDLLMKTDQKFFSRIARKMANHLVWSGHKRAGDFIQYFSMRRSGNRQDIEEDMNRPSRREAMAKVIDLGKEIFALADEYLSDDEILSCIQKWIQEEKASDIVGVLGNHDSTMSEIIDAISRYRFLGPEEEVKLSSHTDMGLRVSLIRQFFFDQLSFINIGKNFIRIEDFYDVVQRVVFPSGSHGKLGGKSAGLFLAYNILMKSEERDGLFKNLRIPQTWYVSSDGLPNFIHYNNLEEVTEQKYKEIDQVRMEYPQIIQLFKNSHFSPDIVRGLSMAIDDIGEKPLIVRSSSLLEDRLGTAFSGKYKSLFLANQGTKQERLDALMDAIAEVYASTFGPDPIEYRKERGLLDFYEEMGIMIQEVVGHKVGKYFLPTFAGVAFSHNEFRWSPRIKREDGLIRLVPGLGTRAVDRTSDDYPILIAPGKPSLKVNITAEDIARYAPRMLDVIDMETNSFETIDINEFLVNFGQELHGVRHMVSKYERNHLRSAGGLIDFCEEDLVVTFDGLRDRTKFVKQVQAVLNILQKELNTPVDIEFASDGSHFYLLQCRPQSYTPGSKGAQIPQNIPPEKMVFSARRYVSDGAVPPISHIVYVDPDGYNNLETIDEMKDIGRAIGKLNKILPKRKFVLIGPGRWGSRGDIKLGVNVTYADFSNTAALIEVAMKKGQYVPELSFGTHFFQDLVESNIRYLPLYPDDSGVAFNWSFFRESKNILPELIPEYKPLADTLRVIDVPKSADGQILRILMNADEEKAVGFLGCSEAFSKSKQADVPLDDVPLEDHWRWRLMMARRIAMQVNVERFGVKKMYIFGSTKNANAGPASDIDLLIHFDGDPIQRCELENWLKGWSLCLAEFNYLRTGYKTPEGLLDVHIITDEDIAKENSFAMKIDAITDPARPLPLKP